MSGAGDYLAKGTALVKRAEQMDREGNVDSAFTLYGDGCEWLILAKRYHCSEKIQERIVAKIKHYMDRMAVLKPQISSRLPALPAEGGPAPSSAPPSNQRNGSSSSTLPSSESTGIFDGAIVSPSKKVSWSDVVGLVETKRTLHEIVINPRKHPDLYTGIRTPSSGVLLYGPPGTGKSFIAAALASEADCTFYSITSADIMSKWVGESGRHVKELFAEARKNRPAIIFIDEIDSLASSRDSSRSSSETSDQVKNQFLTELESVGSDMTDLLFIGATNRPWMLDTAMLRRMPERIYVPLPDGDARQSMIMKQLDKVDHDLSADALSSIVRMTEGYSGADMKQLAFQAIMKPVRDMQLTGRFRMANGAWTLIPDTSPCILPEDTESIGFDDIPSGDAITSPPVTLAHFEAAMKTTQNTVKTHDLEKYEKWTAEYGRRGV